MAKEVPVSGGLVALVDDEDYERISAYKWYKRKGPHTTYAMTNVYHGGSKRTGQMHRMILNAPEDQEVDHVNGDALDNRKSNLRLCSHQDNLRNAGCHRTYAGRPVTSSFKGVYRRPDMKDWLASATVGGKTHYIGHFKTEVEAAQAYDQFIIPLHGEFGRPNLVPRKEGISA